jgi:hypothetical protein
LIRICKKEELSEQWKESIVVPIFKKGGKNCCNNYGGISLLPTAYKLLSNILLSSVWMKRNPSTTDQIFCLHHILEKKMGVQRGSTPAITDWKKAYN